MLVRYFRQPSRIEELRNNTGGYLLEGFAKELSRGRYQWVAARKHIRAAEHFLHWMAHRKLTITSVEERCAQQFLDHLKRCRFGLLACTGMRLSEEINLRLQDLTADGFVILITKFRKSR